MNAITDGQKKQLIRFAGDAVEDVLNKTSIDKDGIQNIIENGGEFQTGIKSIIEKISITKEFADEEVESSHVYPNEYKGGLPLREQIRKVSEIFDIQENSIFLGMTVELPNEAEGWFAIPNIKSIAKKHFPWAINYPEECYCRAVEFILKLIEKSMKGKNYGRGYGDFQHPENLRRQIKTAQAFDQFTEDIIVIPVQYGMRHRGRSARRARACFSKNEFGLGVFELGCMALIHPERYTSNRRLLETLCIGDDYYLTKSEIAIPSLSFETGDQDSFLDTNCNKIDKPEKKFGSVTAFLY